MIRNLHIRLRRPILFVILGGHDAIWLIDRHFTACNGILPDTAELFMY